MEGCAAGRAGSASGHTVDDRLVLYLQRQSTVNLYTVLFHSFCLGNRTGHTVQNVTVCTIRLCKTLGNDSDDDFIGHQCAGIHVLLGLQADRSLVLYCSTENVSGRNCRDVQNLAKNICLSAFSSTRST